MNIDKFIKPQNYIHLCPFCQQELGICDNEYFKNHQQTGYQCNNCCVTNAKTMAGQPFSRYNIGVMKNLQLENIFIDQIIVEETFIIHNKDNEWYDVSNHLIKEQTTIVLTTPTTRELNPFLGEALHGLTWIGELIILPFVDSWELSDQEATLTKLKTYLLFL